jgi:hypothetical protein
MQSRCPPCVHEARTIGAVPRTAEHARIGRVERRAAIDQRMYVIGGQVARWMGKVLDAIARAHPAVLPNVARDHALTQARPAWIGVDRMVDTDARCAWMLEAATAVRREAPAYGAEVAHQPLTLGMVPALITATGGRVAVEVSAIV